MPQFSIALESRRLECQAYYSTSPELVVNVFNREFNVNPFVSTNDMTLSPIVD